MSMPGRTGDNIPHGEYSVIAGSQITIHPDAITTRYLGPIFHGGDSRLPESQAFKLGAASSRQKKGIGVNQAKVRCGGNLTGGIVALHVAVV